MEEELRNSGTNIIMEIWPRPCGGLLSVGSSRGFEFKCEGFGSEGGGLLSAAPDADGGFCLVAEGGRCAHLGNVS